MMFMVVTLASISLLSVNIYADTGCRRDCEAPTLGFLYTGQKVVDKGFTINGRSFDVAEHSQTLPTTTVKTGDRVMVNIIAYDNHGSKHISDISLTLGKYADDDHISKFATISYLKKFVATLRQPLKDTDYMETSTVMDPTSMLKDVTVVGKDIGNGQLSIEMAFSVVKPLDTSDFIISTKDGNGNSANYLLYKGIKVTGKEILIETPQVIKTPPTPLKQTMNKISSDKVVCRDGYEKIIRPSGKVVCVSSYTAGLLKSLGQSS